MNYPMSVIKSVWRRIKKPSRNTIMNIECGVSDDELKIPEGITYRGRDGRYHVNATCVIDTGCCTAGSSYCDDIPCNMDSPRAGAGFSELDWYTPKPKRHGLARH